jgi:8-oxo-dGTP diphosphatase
VAGQLPDSAPAYIAYCPLCGQAMVTQQVDGRPRRVCSSCDYVHFTDPKVGVGALVTYNDQVLLVRRKMEPERGKWSIPAGFLDHGEDPQRTAEREVFEETGLLVHIASLLDVFTNPPSRGGASIFILYRAELLGGEMAAGDDAEAVGFFSLHELPELAFTSTKAAISSFSSQDDSP